MVLLIVEDNLTMRRLLRSLLDGVANSITECEDGSEAIAAYASCLPDWVLMDIRMKDVDGIVATKQIKAQWADARIIIVTDYDDADLREAAFRAGAMEYVVKENLLDVRRILNQNNKTSPCIS